MASLDVEYGFISSCSYSYFDGNYKEINNIGSLPMQSFGIGSVFNLNINKRIAFQIEPLILNKGGQNSAHGINKHSFSLTYIELPVLLKFKIKKPYFQIGVYNSFLLTAKHTYKTRNDRTKVLSSNTEQLTNSFKSIDNGLILGAGLNIHLNNTNKYFTVELQYLKGFTNILNYANPDNDTLKNHAFTFKIGMML